MATAIEVIMRRRRRGRAFTNQQARNWFKAARKSPANVGPTINSIKRRRMVKTVGWGIHLWT